MEPPLDLPVRNALGTKQNNAGAKHVALRRRAFANHGLQRFPIAGPQR
jgi:hypothetical protein